MLLAALLSTLAVAPPGAALQVPPLPATSAMRVDEAISRVLAEDGTPSASVAVVLQDRLVYAKAVGLASISPPKPTTENTRYQLASASKSITAQTLLLLATEGRLSLDAPVSRWLPQITDASHITVRELLEHVSGLPDHYPQSYPAGPRGKPVTPDQIIREWGRHPLLFRPGTQFRYSNLNYVIAGRIAELASGEPLFDLQRQRIFKPLGMDHVANLDEVTATTPDIATGYVQIGLGALSPAPDEGAGWSFGAGQIVATASDLARWDLGLFSAKLLPQAQAAHEEVVAPTLADGSRSPYALGLFVSEKSGRLIWSHVGQGLGFLAINKIYPNEHAAIVVLTNTSASLSFEHIADRIAYILLPPTAADARARSLFAALQRGTTDRTRLTPEFSTYLDGRRLASYCASLGPLGDPASFVLTSEDTADGVTTRRYDVNVGGRRISVVWEEQADGLTDDFLVQPLHG